MFDFLFDLPRLLLWYWDYLGEWLILPFFCLCLLEAIIYLIKRLVYYYV